jgi:phosphatidylglycerophosphatase C
MDIEPDSHQVASEVDGRSERPVVAFDFDGTITSKDTFRFFLTRLRSKRTLAATLARNSPQMAVALRGGAARDDAKRALCLHVLGGLTRQRAEAAAVATADEVLARLIRPDTASRIRWHQARGDRLIVVSASFDAYVRRVAAGLGIDEVIATRWRVEPDSEVLSGLLDGPNVRGEAKVELLEAHLGRPCRLAFAYGNSSGDTAMLARAREGVWVGRRPLPEFTGDTVR